MAGRIMTPHLWLVAFSAGMAVLMALIFCFDDDPIGLAIGVLNAGCAAMNLWIWRREIFASSPSEQTGAAA